MASSVPVYDGTVRGHESSRFDTCPGLFKDRSDFPFQAFYQSQARENQKITRDSKGGRSSGGIEAERRSKNRVPGQNRNLTPAFRDIPEKLTLASRGALTPASVGLSLRMKTSGKSPWLSAAAL